MSKDEPKRQCQKCKEKVSIFYSFIEESGTDFKYLQLCRDCTIKLQDKLLELID